VDRLGQPAPSLDELKQIQDEARSSNSLTNLRTYFDRVQELRRIHSGNFDVQLVAAEAQEEIIERARDLRSRSEIPETTEEIFAKPSPVRHDIERPAQDVEDFDETPPAEAFPENRQSWRRATYLALFLTAVILVVFFYLIQTARRINLAPPSQPAAKPAETAKGSSQPANNAGHAPPLTPTVRLYTDLIPGTVSVDDGDPQDLKDGELVLDHLEPGRHSIKVAGRSGTADFSFDVSDNSAPQPVAPVSASNAMAVLVSAQNGKGHLLTSVQQPDISLDGKPAGQVGPDGLALDNLGTTDHELQVAEANDHQRFVMTYTSAPVLTVYVKSDPSTGTVTVLTKVDGANVFINDKPSRRTTDHGQLRIPLKVGGYVIRVHKDGFVDPPSQSVNVKKGEESELAFDLQPLQNLASLEVRDAAPGTAIYVDNTQVGKVGPDGIGTAQHLPNGDHSVQLTLDGAVPKKFQRAFPAGKTVLLAGPDTTLQKTAPESKPPEQPVTTNAPAEEEAPPPVKPVDIPGEQVRRGGGFVHYNVPKTSGHYSFKAHSKIGGFLKHDKLQWYAGYENSDNYVLFSVDGKHATIRETKAGKSREISRIPFATNSGEWVQVDMSVKPDAISARVKTSHSDWSDLGVVSGDGRDFTQDNVGFYLPGNDEVAVANFRFINH
jgi:hypothetical protein